MPELTPQSISPLVKETSTWEDREGFRETLLLHFTRPGDAEAMRHFGAMLYECALLCAGEWPDWPGTTTWTELQAAAADLRHLEAFLTAIGQEHRTASLSLQDNDLSRFAALQAEMVGSIAYRIKVELARTGRVAEGG